MQELAIAAAKATIPGLAVAGLASILDAYFLPMSWDHYFFIVFAGSLGNVIGQFMRHPRETIRDLKSRLPKI